MIFRYDAWRWAKLGTMRCAQKGAKPACSAGSPRRRKPLTYRGRGGGCGVGGQSEGGGGGSSSSGGGGSVDMVMAWRHTSPPPFPSILPFHTPPPVEERTFSSNTLGAT